MRAFEPVDFKSPAAGFSSHGRSNAMEIMRQPAHGQAGRINRISNVSVRLGGSMRPEARLVVGSRCPALDEDRVQRSRCRNKSAAIAMTAAIA